MNRKTNRRLISQLKLCNQAPNSLMLSRLLRTGSLTQCMVRDRILRYRILQTTANGLGLSAKLTEFQMSVQPLTHRHTQPVPDISLLQHGHVPRSECSVADLAKLKARSEADMGLQRMHFPVSCDISDELERAVASLNSAGLRFPTGGRKSLRLIVGGSKDPCTAIRRSIPFRPKNSQHSQCGNLGYQYSSSNIVWSREIRPVAQGACCSWRKHSLQR